VIKVPCGKKKIEDGGRFQKYVLACNSEQLRKEWIFQLSILRSYEGVFSMRKSLMYLNQQKKLSIWSESVGPAGGISNLNKK
jgi:hypothetical protein